MKIVSIHSKFIMTALFIAIIFALAFTPIGFIQLGLIKATVIHIPVILGSIILGPKAGALLGGIFGLTSFISNTVTPTLLSFAFSPLIPLPGSDRNSGAALLVCFIPRILVGVVPYYTFRLCQKLWNHRKNLDGISLVIAGLVGSLTNTILVLHLIYLFFQDAYAVAKHISSGTVYSAIMAIVAANGVPEALASGIIVAALGKVLLKLPPKQS